MFLEHIFGALAAQVWAVVVKVAGNRTGEYRVNSVFIPSLGHRTDTYFVQHTIKGQETLEERDWWRFLTMPKDVGMPL